MQIALPRTHDAGKVQEQLNQRSQLAQDQLAHSLQKEVDIKRTQVEKNSDSEKLHLNKENSEQQQSNHNGKNKKQKQQDENSDHPYKGKKIDLLG